MGRMGGRLKPKYPLNRFSGLKSAIRDLSEHILFSDTFYKNIRFILPHISILLEYHELKYGSGYSEAHNRAPWENNF